MLIRDIEIESMCEEEIERYISKQALKRNLYHASKGNKKPLPSHDLTLTIDWEYTSNNS